MQILFMFVQFIRTKRKNCLATVGVCVFRALASTGALFFILRRIHMSKRSLFVTFILMNTLGIFYMLYWIASIQDGFKYRTKQSTASGVTVVVFIILTLGLYCIIWQWKACRNLKALGANDNRVLTLILSLLLIGIIVNQLIIQSSINSLNSYSFYLKDNF